MVKFITLLSNGNIKDNSVSLKSEDRNKSIKNLLKYKKKIE